MSRGSFRKELIIGPRRSMSANEVPVFVGNAGTAMRFFTGWLAFTPGRFLLHGEERMHQRPIGDLVDVLLSIGAEVEYAGEEGYPPLRIRGKRMRGGFDVTISAETSSQFVSALMLGGATLPDGITLRISSLASGPYIDITADILSTFGAPRRRANGNVVNVRAGRLGAGGVSRRRRLLIGVLLVRRRRGDAAARCAFGAWPCRPRRATPASWTSFTPWVARCRSTRSDRRRDRGHRRRRRSRGGRFDCNATPDLVPTLAAIAPLASSPVEIVNVANLRVKESDRLATVTSELRRLGATVEERPDSLLI